jgi:hypothetical protein
VKILQLGLVGDSEIEYLIGFWIHCIKTFLNLFKLSLILGILIFNLQTFRLAPERMICPTFLIS